VAATTPSAKRKSVRFFMPAPSGRSPRPYC